MIETVFILTRCIYRNYASLFWKGSFLQPVSNEEWCQGFKPCVARRRTRVPHEACPGMRRIDIDWYSLRNWAIVWEIAQECRVVSIRIICCRIQCVFWHGEACQHLDMHYLDQNPLLIAFGITTIIGYSSIIDDHNIFFHPFGGKILKTCTWQQHRRTSNSNRPEFEFDQFIGQQTQVAILQPFQCFVFKFGMRIKRIETDFCFACICVCCLKCIHGPVMCVYVLLLLLCFAVSLWFRKANTTRLAGIWSNSPPKASRSDTTACGKGVLQGDWVPELQKVDVRYTVKLYIAALLSQMLELPWYTSYRTLFHGSHNFENFRKIKKDWTSGHSLPSVLPLFAGFPSVFPVETESLLWTAKVLTSQVNTSKIGGSHPKSLPKCQSDPRFLVGDDGKVGRV